MNVPGCDSGFLVNVERKRILVVKYYQREKLGTLGRVSEIYTNIYHLFLGF